MTEKRYCKQCGKELVRKKYKCITRKRGWCWENPKMFLGRIFCNSSCKATHQHKELGHTLWNKEIILKRFNNIKTDKKWNGHYMSQEHSSLYKAIEIHYKKHFWNKFVIEQGKIPMLNKLNPRYRIDAKNLLKYWRDEEITNGIGKIFQYSVSYGLPGYKLDFEGGNGDRALKYLIKMGVIKLFKIGKGGTGGSAYPSQYILLKSRI